MQQIENSVTLTSCASQKLQSPDDCLLCNCVSFVRSAEGKAEGVTQILIDLNNKTSESDIRG